jgi:hypothetical protein
MQWSQFQDTADRLSRGATEGDWRSAISRGYYAVFHYFREFFNLYSGLQNCGVPSVGPIAMRIDDLRAKRVWSDYQLARRVSQSLAAGIVQASHSVIVDFQAALAASQVSPAQIAAGVRQHLQAIGRLGKTP